MALSRDDLLAPILRDVAACAGLAVRIEHEQDTPGWSEPWTMLWTPDGAGTGIWFGDQQDQQGVDHRPWRVADAVHEAVVEGLWSAGRSTAWPPCPAHPDTHPLEVGVQAGRIVWACPTSGERVAEVGGLTC